MGDGRLDLPRYEERVRAVLASTTEAQVVPLLADLLTSPRPAAELGLACFYAGRTAAGNDPRMLVADVVGAFERLNQRG